jgi:hypothetical protein
MLFTLERRARREKTEMFYLGNPSGDQFQRNCSGKTAQKNILTRSHKDTKKKLLIDRYEIAPGLTLSRMFFYCILGTSHRGVVFRATHLRTPDEPFAATDAPSIM